MQRTEIYKELLDAHEKQFNRANPVYYAGTFTHPWDKERYVAVTFNNNVAYFFKESEFMVDLNKLAAQKPLINYDALFAPHYERELRDTKKSTYEDIVVNDRKYRVVKAGTKWIDVRHLKWFYKPKFKTSMHLNSGIWLFEDDEPVGFVMPLALNYKGGATELNE